MTYSSPTEARPGRRSAWIAVLLLAWFQLVLAGHQLDHGSDTVGSDCETCIQFERLDDVVVDDIRSVPVPHRSGAVETAFSNATQADFFAGYRSRAPPLI